MTFEKTKQPLRARDRFEAASPVHVEESALIVVSPGHQGHNLSKTPIIPAEPIQAKLDISQDGDPLEEEADRVADEVMRSPDQSRAPTRVRPAANIPRPSLEAIAGRPDAVPASVARAAVESEGHPLDQVTRAFMEPRFGFDFSRVQVHRGTSASDAAASVSARAYTVGNDIVFGAGEYAPQTTKGMHLLAHELTHVAQKAGADTIHRAPDTPSPAAPVPSPGPTGQTGQLVVAADLIGTEKELRCSTKGEARQALTLVRLQMLDLADQLDDVGESALTAMAATTQAEVAKLVGEGELTPAEIGSLDGFLGIANAGERQLLDQAVQRFLSFLPTLEPDAASVEKMQALDDAINEQAHKAFDAKAVHELERAIKYEKKISTWNGTVGKYAGKAKSVGDFLKGGTGTALAKAAGKIKDASKSLKDGLEDTKTVLEIADEVATMVGADNISNGTAMMQGISSFRAGWGLCDRVASKFGKAVPVFSDLWEKYYKPLVNACLKELEKIAVVQEYRDREAEVGWWRIQETTGTLQRSAAGAPLISATEIAKGTFPGGQPVLDYLYSIKFGTGKPALSDFVRDYFLDRKDLFNEADVGDTDLKSDWSLLSPSTWVSNKNRKTNLEEWIPANIGRLWGLFYGEMARQIPQP